MLVRAYRLTDKFGVITLKLSVALVDALLDGVGVVWGAISAVLLLLVGAVWFVLRPLLLLIGGAILGAFGITRPSGRARNAQMARRAARAQIDSTVIEDPLRAQNRVLSGVTVLLLAILVGVVLWATNPARTTGISAAEIPFDASLFASPDAPLVPTDVAAAALDSTPIPTITPLPSILEVAGSMAYTVRENGQTDVWAIPVGSRQPIRLTNDPADERDPAFSPDGRRIAYAGHSDGNWELYVYDLTDGSTQRLTYDPAFQANPSWSSDGVWLTYEYYQDDTHIDIYVLRVDGTQAPIRIPANSASPDYAPSWSPDGRRIAFVSLRDGNQDIYVFSFDDQSVTNVTRTPTRDEDHPAWSPDARFLAYSALDAGQEKVFVIDVDNPDTGAQVINRGRAPTWSPDGSAVVGAVDTIDGTQMIVNPFTSASLTTGIIPAPRGATAPSWTRTALPTTLVNSGGLPPAILEPLYVEEEDRDETDPPYRLNAISNVTVENAALSDRVNDSFNALRAAVNDHAGWDFLGRLDDAFWRIERPPQPGEERRNWLMTGRSFAIQRSAIAGFPPPLEIVREDIGVETYWRVFLRVSDDAQAGQLGEPLRQFPWDFAARTAGDVEAYDAGGRLRSEVPEGYYIDLTQIAADYGWDRAPAGSDWRANSNTIYYWSFRKNDGLSWYEAMREIYTEAQLGGFAPTAIPVDAPRPTAPPLEIQPSQVPQALPTSEPVVPEAPTTPPDQAESQG